MTALVIRRLLQAALALAATSLVVFVGVFAVCDPVRLLLPPDATDGEVAAAVLRLGLDRPWWEQYLRFVESALRGDLGTSFVHGSPAVGLVLERMPATLELAGASMLLAVGAGVPLGLYAGLRGRDLGGRLVDALAVVGFSVPTFWAGLLLTTLFSVRLGWLPSFGRGPVVEVLGVLPVSFLSAEGLAHLALPALTLALFKVGFVVRLTRSEVEELLQADFVRFARAKGLRWRRIVSVHILKNIAIPLVTVLGLQLGQTIVFTVVTEKIFAWPGMGKLLVESIHVLDRPVIVAYLLITVALIVAINLVVDVLYPMLDPRVRSGDGSAA